jgi:hypothetical protein
VEQEVIPAEYRVVLLRRGEVVACWRWKSERNDRYSIMQECLGAAYDAPFSDRWGVERMR